MTTHPTLQVAQNSNYIFFKQPQNIISLLVLGILTASAVHYDILGSVHPVYFSTAGALVLVGIAWVVLERYQASKSSRLGTTSEAPVVVRTRIVRTDQAQPNFTTITYQHEISNSDLSQYSQWLLEDEQRLLLRQKEILILTAEKVLPWSVPAYTMITERNRNMSLTQSELNKKVTTVDYEAHADWAYYDVAGHYYVDFANAYEFGGGYRSGGAVQEEMMFWMIPKLVHLAFASEKANAPIKIWGNESSEGAANSFIVHNVERYYDLRHIPYGQAFYRASDSQLARTAERLSAKDKKKVLSTTAQGLAPLVMETPDSPAVNIIGLAALDWRSEKVGRLYRKEELLYHYKAALFAFQAAALQEQTQGKKPIIHTGAWGCGAFGNSEKTMIFIQLLAAGAANVKVVFHGVDNDARQPYYTTDFIKARIKDLATGTKTVEECFNWILKEQETDRSWSTKSDPS